VTDPALGRSPDDTKWQQVLAQSVRYVLAPLILFSSGFFTANFLISGQYTWPRTSRAAALTLTVFVLCYEFVYKEHRTRTGSHERARAVLLYACVIPYIAGAMIMVALWKL